ncbi:hypothetical protein ACFVGN_42510, partial [Streptomyces sp. NPDC057757]|uniref:hypothetical protein n=1 Tax=Streptomyces sp. NPDC057757 TaxID=3346241 RepID=UPI0036B103E1
IAGRPTRPGHAVHVSPAVTVDDGDPAEAPPCFEGCVKIEHIPDLVDRTGMSPAHVATRRPG